MSDTPTPLATNKTFYHAWGCFAAMVMMRFTITSLPPSWSSSPSTLTPPSRRQRSSSSSSSARACEPERRCSDAGRAERPLFAGLLWKRRVPTYCFCPFVLFDLVAHLFCLISLGVVATLLIVALAFSLHLPSVGNGRAAAFAAGGAGAAGAAGAA